MTNSPTADATRPRNGSENPLKEISDNQIDERTDDIVQKNLARIRMLVVAATLLLHQKSRDRVMRLLRNYQRWELEPPWVVLEAHNTKETAAAENFSLAAKDCAQFEIVQTDHHRGIAEAVKRFQNKLAPKDSAFEAKRKILFLTRRGGQGKPNFIKPFTGGGGTTCGEWTCIVEKKPDGTCIRGFIKGSVAVGFCPVECRVCYLNAYQMDSMDLALNLENLQVELQRDWSGWPYPINFGETGGLVELDRLFVDEKGNGSLVQTVIDACAETEVIPFFLAKIAFPRYLTFQNRVKVGISMMPEEIRPEIAPYGSPTDELLDSLQWAVAAGAEHPVVRLFVLWEQRDLYPELLKGCRDRLGTDGWQLTVDLPRFTPATLSSIAKRYPEVASSLAAELDPSGTRNASQIASAARKAKKARPPLERQVEVYRGVRTMLDDLGCRNVPITGCKGDPAELRPLVREKVIRMMPCACYNPPGT